jgi:hypothetical protein
VALVLAQLPYKARITSRANDSGGIAWRLGVEVTDTTGILVKRTTIVSVPRTTDFGEFIRTLQEEVGIAMVTDAGGRAAFLDFLVSNGVLMNFF